MIHHQPTIKPSCINYIHVYTCIYYIHIHYTYKSYTCMYYIYTLYTYTVCIYKYNNIFMILQGCKWCISTCFMVKPPHDRWNIHHRGAGSAARRPRSRPRSRRPWGRPPPRRPRCPAPDGSTRRNRAVTGCEDTKNICLYIYMYVCMYVWMIIHIYIWLIIKIWLYINMIWLYIYDYIYVIIYTYDSIYIYIV